MERVDRLPLHPVRIASVPEHDPVIVRFLGPLQGLPTHHTRKEGSVACEGDICPPAIHRLKRVWKFYGAAEEWRHSEKVWRPCVLEVTECLEELLRGRRLRGEVWMLIREGDRGKSSRVTGTLCETLSDVMLTAEFDIYPVLQRRYRVEKLLLGLPNPTPPRLLLSDVVAAPPRVPRELLPPPPAPAADPALIKALIAKAMDRLKPAADVQQAGNGTAATKKEGT